MRQNIIMVDCFYKEADPTGQKIQSPVKECYSAIPRTLFGFKKKKTKKG